MQDLHSTDPTQEACATVLRVDHKGPTRQHEVLMMMVLIFVEYFVDIPGYIFARISSDKAPSGRAEVGVGVRLGFKVDVKSMSSHVL